MKKFRNILIVLVCIYLFLLTFSHHEKVDFFDINELTYRNYLGTVETNSYTEEKEIKHILKKLEHVNFYKIKSGVLQESPTSAITICYKNGMQKKIYLSGIFAMIVMEKNSQIIDKGEFYVVNPVIIKRIFR